MKLSIVCLAYSLDFAKFSDYHTKANTSPPTPNLRASLSVTTPWFVDIIAVPSPPSTFGRFSWFAYIRSPGFDILLIPDMIFSLLSAPYFNDILIAHGGGGDRDP